MAETYEILSVAPRTRAVGGNVFAKVNEVTFRTKLSGLVGTVDIMADEFTPEHVAEVVSAQAQNLEAVKAL